MKLIVPLIGLGCLSAGLWGEQASDVTVIISGGARGHLSPCGCTKPMSGGLMRLATLIRQYKKSGNVVWIDAGDITAEPGRQSQLKAETYSETLGDLQVDAVAYTSSDQRQGMGLLTAGTSLSRAKWISDTPDPINMTVRESTTQGLSISTANTQGQSVGLERPSDILLFDGRESEYTSGRIEHKLIVTNTDGIPTVAGNRVSPGSNLRGVVIAKFHNGEFVSARVELLPAEVKEDPRAKSIYDNYLHRVTEEKLIERVLRESKEVYIGSKNCMNCHGKIAEQYSHTKHATAYQTLVKEKHGADPDCLPCHVVGLNSTNGFVYQRTPSLAQVGCESCHGPGQDHARWPKKFKLPKVTNEKCITCHTPSNSPNFNFQSYWKKIKH